MSRVGTKPLEIPGGVQVKVDGTVLDVSGPKGAVRERIVPGIRFVFGSDAKTVKVEREGDSKLERSLHGLYRRLLENMVKGVVAPYTRALDIVGVGYSAKLQGKDLVLQVGYAHSIVVKSVEGVTFAVPQPTHIVVSGCDKQKVGALAAKIRAVRPPEPYQGKGIRYEGEAIQRKAGKTFVSGGT